MKNGMCGIAGLLAIVLLILAGCGEDENCPTCNQLEDRSLMFGYVALDGDILVFNAAIWGDDETIPEIDSVTVAGYDADVESGITTGLPRYWIDYYAFGGSLVSGDTATVKVFTPQGTSICRIECLELSDDRPDIIGWSMSGPFDTVSLGSTITVDWHTIELADWYQVQTEYKFGPDYEDRESRQFIAFDTTFTVPALDTNLDGRYNIVIRAMTGPTPDDPMGNIEGGIIKGVINSQVENGVTIIVGEGI